MTAEIKSLYGKESFEPQKLNRSSKLSDNGNGGERPMDNKYVTHKELELSNEKLLHHIDNKFAEMQHQMDQHFNDVDKQFGNVKLEVNDVKNTANNNKEKINWVLYSVIGGVALSIITTIITNLLSK